MILIFAAIGVYLYVNTTSQATGGRPLPPGKPVLGEGKEVRKKERDHARRHEEHEQRAVEESRPPGETSLAPP